MPDWIKIVFEAMNKYSWAIALAMLGFLYWPEEYLSQKANVMRDDWFIVALLVFLIALSFALSKFITWLKLKWMETQRDKAMINAFNDLSLKERELVLWMYTNNQPTIQQDIDDPVINKLISFRYLVLLGGSRFDMSRSAFLHNVSLSPTCTQLLQKHLEELVDRYQQDKKLQSRTN